MEKADLRKLIREKRAGLESGQKSIWDEKLFQKLASHPLIVQADCVCCYMSIGGEAGTRRLLDWLWERGREAAVPRVQDGDMNFFLIRSMEDLSPGCMGILEPKAHCPKAERSDAPVITPGVAFGPAGERCGYGGGYYDRFFQREPGHCRIGIAYDFQILPELELEPYDQKVDEIITPDHHYICNAKVL